MALGPGIRKVVDYIRDQTASGALKSGALLPNRDALSRALQASPGTIAAAIACLKREGILSGVKGQRCRVADRSSQPSVTPALECDAVAALPSADLIAANIKDDIVAGVFKPGEAIPRSKELCGHYHTCRQTVRKSIDRLLAKKLLIRRGKRFAVPRVALHSASAYIVFVWFNIEPSLPVFDLDTSFLGIVERECFRNSVRLEKIIVSVRNGAIVLWRYGNPAPADPRIIESSMGILYFVNWYASVNSTVFDWLANQGKPLSIVDWLGGWAAPPALSSRPRTQWVRTFAARKPGFDVGRFLAGLGHRRIAYFSPFSRAWSLTRFEGIEEALSLAGPAYSATAFIQNQSVSEPEINEKTRRRYHTTVSLLGSASGISPDYAAGSSRIMAAVWIAQEGDLYFSILLPLFERALSQKEITAWVGCDDNVAMMAWSFLASRKKLDYRKIALAGFGNTFETVKADMTSYDFNFERAAGSILTFLLRPSFAGHFRKLAHPEIDGFVIERGSTAVQRYYRMKAA